MVTSEFSRPKHHNVLAYHCNWVRRGMELNSCFVYGC